MTNTVGAQLGRKLDRMAVELARARRTAMSRAALAVTSDVRDEVRKVTGGDMRLSGVGRRGARVGARYKLYGEQGDPYAVVMASGPLHLIERDTKAHTIEPKRRGRGRNASKGRGVKLRSGDVRARVEHPGTKGKRPFGKGVDSGKPKAERILRNVTTDAVRRGLRAG